MRRGRRLSSSVLSWSGEEHDCSGEWRAVQSSVELVVAEGGNFMRTATSHCSQNVNRAVSSAGRICVTLVPFKEVCWGTQF